MASAASKGIERAPSLNAARFDEAAMGDVGALCAQAGWFIRRGSGRSRPAPGTEELEQVVGEADEGPLPADLLNTPQPEAAKAPRGFDLAEHRLGNGLAASIDGPPEGGVQLPAHRLAEGPLAVAPGRHRATVREPIRRDIKFDPRELRRRQIRFAKIAGVRRHLRRSLPH